MCAHCEYRELAKVGVDVIAKATKESLAKRDSVERTAFLVNVAAAHAYVPTENAHSAAVSAAEEMVAKSIAEQVLEHRADMPFTDTPSFISGMAFGITMGLRQGYVLMGIAEKRALIKVLGGADDEEGVHGKGHAPDRTGGPGT
jgi:hypothetical protein